MILFTQSDLFYSKQSTMPSLEVDRGETVVIYEDITFLKLISKANSRCSLFCILILQSFESARTAFRFEYHCSGTVPVLWPILVLGRNSLRFVLLLGANSLSRICFCVYQSESREEGGPAVRRSGGFAVRSAVRRSGWTE